MEITAAIFTPASLFSYEEMINRHDSRGKGTVFFLMINLALSFSCNFTNNPISSDYMKKINDMIDHTPGNYRVEVPRIISEEKEDQNCKHLLNLILSSLTLSKTIEGSVGSEWKNKINKLQNEILFLKKCSFKIPSGCPNEMVNFSTFLQNLNASLVVLKPNIHENFTHCLQAKCATVENAKELRNTSVTRRPNRDQEDSTVDVLSKDHTTPKVKHHDGSSDNFFGGHEDRSNGGRTHYLWITIILVLFLVVIVCFIIWKPSKLCNR